MQLSDEEWKARLTAEEFRVLRSGQTERGSSGALLAHFETGLYCCAGCGATLFSSEDKYDSGTGWPAFSAALDGLAFRDDPLHGMKRIEAICAGCGGHLGHLFDDLDSPTKQRYCINSVALRFRGEGGGGRSCEGGPHA